MKTEATRPSPVTDDGRNCVFLSSFVKPERTNDVTRRQIKLPDVILHSKAGSCFTGITWRTRSILIMESRVRCSITGFMNVFHRVCKTWTNCMDLYKREARRDTHKHTHTLCSHIMTSPKYAHKKKKTQQLNDDSLACIKIAVK